MGYPSRRRRDDDGHERAMTSLSARTGAPLALVRDLFALEFARLGLGATVRSYLALLTTANVRAMLRVREKALAGVRADPANLSRVSDRATYRNKPGS